VYLHLLFCYHSKYHILFIGPFLTLTEGNRNEYEIFSKDYKGTKLCEGLFVIFGVYMCVYVCICVRVCNETRKSRIINNDREIH
jgi:hypothetical protein